MSKVACIDLFCGAGGLTHGLIQAGIPVVAGIDVDAACRYPFETNNKSHFIAKDIKNVKPADLKKLYGDAEIRILAGCAPCQPFSAYSQRYDTLTSPRWPLLYQFARLIKSVRPDVVTMENVPLVEKHAVFDDFVTTLRRLGYNVWQGVVDCTQYGLPQTRRRMVILASAIGPIHHDILPPRTKRRPISGPLQGGQKSLGTSGRLPERGDFGLHRLRVDASAFRDLPLGIRDGPFRTWRPIALGMRALDAFMPERPLQLAGDHFVFQIIMAIGDRDQGLRPHPPPHHMDMLAPEFFMHHHGTRLAGESKLFLQTVDGLLPVLHAKPLMDRHIDGSVIERVLAPRARRQRFHFMERPLQIVGNGSPHFDDFHPLVGVNALQMRRQFRSTRPRLPLDDHGCRPRALISASRISSRSS